MFETLSLRAPDAIIALMHQAQADTRETKIDLGVGVYKNTDGETPIMRAVEKAQIRWRDEEDTKLYMGTTGTADFRKHLLELVLGEDHHAHARIASSQAAGGSGALRIGAELIQESSPGATVWHSTPTWANHVPLIGGAGLELKPYPYYDRENLAVDFTAMMQTLETGAKAGDIVLLHGCCHNPTGADLSDEEWDALAAHMSAKGLIPFIDLAYLGLGRGLREDAYGLLACIEACPEVLFSVSCSKNFALYRERVGLIALVARDEDSAAVVQTHFGAIQRKLISMPPAWGANVVSTILGDRELRHVWNEELTEMRTRIRRLRLSLADELNVPNTNSKHGEDLARAVRDQQGMFSMLPVTPAQAESLRSDHGIYITNTGRMNIAAANLDNIPRLADALLKLG